MGGHTPPVVIPTIRDRESNVRRLASLGAGEVVMPVDGEDGGTRVDMAEFTMKVKRVLHEPSYREPASLVAQSMRQYGGAVAAAQPIEEGVWAQQ